MTRKLLLPRSVLAPMLLLLVVGLLSACATSAPTVWPSAANSDPTPINVEFYVKQDADECPIAIVSRMKCQSAALHLGLPTTAATTQTGSDQPKGCYVKWLYDDGCRRACVDVSVGVCILTWTDGWETILNID